MYGRVHVSGGAPQHGNGHEGQEEIKKKTPTFSFFLYSFKFTLEAEHNDNKNQNKINSNAHIAHRRHNTAHTHFCPLSASELGQLCCGERPPGSSPVSQMAEPPHPSRDSKQLADMCCCCYVHL